MPFDKQLQPAVLAELDWEPSVVAGHICVTANAGVVTLTGHVESFAEKYAADTTARHVKGAKAVAEEIKVAFPPEWTRGGDDIAAAAIERLAWDTSVPPDAIMVTVEQGWITLTGRVPWYYQKQAAEQAVARLHGGNGISNLLLVKPAVDVAKISNRIRHALRRSWLVNDETVTVRADGGRVHLTGTVQLPHDREAAWAAPGATSVENDIAIL